MDTREETCGKKIKNYRKEIGYSQERFAKVMGISVPTLRNYEKGRMIPDSEFLARFSAFFGISPERILYELGLLNTTDRKAMFPDGENIDPKKKKGILKETKHNI